MLDNDEDQQTADGISAVDGSGAAPPYDDEAWDEEEWDEEPTLTDDVLALIEDGKTYVEAELAFQKSRATYSANRIKGAAVFALGAFGVLHLALIALTVGMVIALVPLVGAWGATAIVTLSLLMMGAIFVYLLKQRIDDVRAAFSDNADD